MTTVALVTGGATGIGWAVSRELHRRGCAVVVAGRDRSALARATREAAGLLSVVCDVRDPDDAREAVTAALARWGRLDVLVNNAGILRLGGLRALDAATVDDLYRTNVIGAANMVEAALDALVAAGGRIVNVSSTYAGRPAPQEAHYAATKAALESLGRSWALELAPKGVRVNTIAPGPTATDILVRSGLGDDEAAAMTERSAGRMPLGRLADVDEVGRWIARFCVDESLFTTGQTLVIDGGLSLV